jgi:Ca2+-binding RTX toxin-like protein
MTITQASTTTKLVKSDAIDDTLRSTYYEDNAITITESSLLANDLSGYKETTTIDWWTLWLPYTTKSDYANNCKIISVQDATNGTVSFKNGVVTFVPNANYTGPAQFSYTIKDDNGLIDTATVKFNITNVNDTPEAFNDSITANTTTVTIAASTLLANDKDADGNTLKIYSVQDAKNGKVTFDGTNVIFTPNAGYTGPASFRYTITDGQPGKDKDSATVNLTIEKPVPVTLVNFDDGSGVPPTGWYTDNTGGLIEVRSSTAFGLSGNASNVVELERNSGDASNLYTLVNSTAGKNIVVNFDYSARPNYTTGTDSAIQILANGKVIDTVNATSAGFKSYQYTIAGTGETIRIEFKAVGANSVGGLLDNIKISSQNVVTNTAPDAQNDTANGTADNALVISASTLLANDTDANNDSLTITSVQNATNGTVSLNGTNVTFTPKAGYTGPASFTYTISDGKGGTDTATVNLTITATTPVNTAPDAQDDSTNVAANTALVILPVTNLLANDKDANGDTLTVTSVQNAVNGTVSLVDGNVQFTPTAGYSGPASFTYTISDGKGGTDTATVNLTIAGSSTVNSAPDAKDDTITGTAGTQIKISPATLLGNDVDANGDALQGVGLGDAVNGEVAYIDGNVVFLPTAGYTGPASFTYTITDGKGGYDTATVNLTIVADPNANVGPDAKDDAVVGKMDTQIKISPATLLGNDVDANGDALQGVGLGNAVNGEVAYIDGNVVFLPTAGYTGPASFTYTITDGKGGYDTATVNLTIVADTETNIAPDAQNDTASGTQDSAIVISSATLLANDVDANSDSLTITSVQAATNGTVSLSGGNVTFTPTSGYNGPASFTYTVSDGKGGTDTATVNLTIAATTAVNVAPDAVNDTISGEKTGAVLIDPETILANDTDANGDKLEILDLKNAVNGSVGYENGKIVFTPTAGYSGPASFEYVVQDGKGGFDTATVNLTISSVAVLSAANDKVDATQSGELLINPSNLLANDSGENISIVDLNNAQNGTVSFDGTNIVFTPTAGYNGPASFEYVIQDAQGSQKTATVSLTVYAALGTNQNDAMTGSTGNDTLYSLDGNDTVNGAAGNDEIDGGAGTDTLNGQAGNDTIAGNLGDDTISGGAGNDNLYGGVDNDTFVWTLSDTTAAGVEVDTVNDFSAGDKLNLKDLLQGETYTPEALDNYLHFDYADGNTTVSISTTGAFGNGAMTGSTPAAGTVDQQIVLIGLDLTAGLTNSDQQAIQTLLNNNALVI